MQKAIGGIENALLDLKGKALGVSVAELFGGPTRDTDPALLVALRHHARARLGGDGHAEARLATRAVAALGREVVERGYGASRRTSSSPATSRGC